MMLGLRPEDAVKRLNRMLIGWANYFSLGPVHKAYRAVDHYTAPRLPRWLCNKHKVSNTGARRFPYEHLYGTLGLVQRAPITSRVRRPDVLAESRMRNRMSGSPSGERKRDVAAWPKSPRLSSTLRPWRATSEYAIGAGCRRFCALCPRRLG
jgi:hypothetical protein